MRFVTRTVAMVVGIVGAAVALVIDFLYSFFFVLGRVSGVTADTGHFWWGLAFTFVGFVGALLSIASPVTAAVLMLITGVAFFWIVGWWALLIAPFFLVAAGIALLARNREVTTTAMG